MATIAELILEQGRQQAANRQRQGELQNQTWQRLADIAGQYGSDVRRQQADAPRRELESLALQNARDQQRGNQVLDQALQPVTPQGPAEGGGNLPPQHPYLGADGLYDTAKLQDAFAAQGVAHLAPEILKNVDALNDSVTKHKAAVQKAAESKTVLLGDLADTARKMHKQGTPLDQALDFAAQSGLTTGAIDPKEYQQARAQILSMPPEQQDQALGTLMDSAAKIGGGKTLAKDAIEYDRYGRQIGSNIVPDKVTPSRALFAQIMNDPTKTPAQRAQAKQSFDAMTPDKIPNNGAVHDTPNGLVRIGADGTATPVVDVATGKPVSGYHAPVADSVVRVEHKDPVTGKTVIEFMPKSEVRGKTFEKGTNATTENRLASAQAVTQVGNDIIAKLKEPNVAAQLGPAMGRYNNLQEFIGNPPPEFAELAGDIESFSLANMGVHGMRSVQGADEIKKLLTGKHTPESLTAGLKGLMNFTNHFMQNEGRTGPAASAGAVRKYNPATGKVE